MNLIIDAVILLMFMLIHHTLLEIKTVLIHIHRHQLDPSTCQERGGR